MDSHTAKNTDMLAMVITGSDSQHPSCSTSHSKSQGNSHSSTPGPQGCHILAALGLDATPHCVASIKLQTQVIKRQNAQHIIGMQLHNHLKTQLTNRSHPHEHIGATLKQEEKEWQKELKKVDRQCQNDAATAAMTVRAAEIAQ